MELFICQSTKRLCTSIYFIYRLERNPSYIYMYGPFTFINRYINMKVPSSRHRPLWRHCFLFCTCMLFISGCLVWVQKVHWPHSIYETKYRGGKLWLHGLALVNVELNYLYTMIYSSWHCVFYCDLVHMFSCDGLAWRSFKDRAREYCLIIQLQRPPGPRFLCTKTIRTNNVPALSSAGIKILWNIH